jgi:predicted nuclease of predicted toxin-antitoxin system
MSIRLLVDMNLSPEWIAELAKRGFNAVHWSTVGDPHAADTTIMSFARNNEFVVFTHDLDFGTLLALTHAAGPSVLQVRGQNVLPDHMGALVAAALHLYEAALTAGALVVVEERKLRVRVLPL